MHLTYPLRTNVSLSERRDGAAGLTGETQSSMLRVPRYGELQLSRTAAAVVRAEVLHSDDFCLSVTDHQLTVTHQQSAGVVAGDSNREDFARRRVDAVAETEDELVRRRGL